MRILITGSNGLLGQKLLRILSPDIHSLIGCDLVGRSLILLPSHEYRQLDITNRKAAVEAIRSIHPQVIIHTAAITDVDGCERDKERCWQVNVVGTDAVAAGAAKVGAKVVFISSDYVFNGQNGPYNEDDKPDPINYYGRSKLAAENIIRGSSVDWAIVRTIVLYGTGILIRSSFVTWLLEMLRANRELRVVSDQWGNTTLVDDLAAAIERIILLHKTGVYHIGGSQFVTRYEFARIIAAFFGLKVNLIHPILTGELRQPAPRPLRSGLEIDKAERELYISFHNIKQSLEIYRSQEAELG